MIEFLSEYGLFLAKTLTLVIGILVVFSTLFSLAQRTRSEGGTLTITSVNQKMTEIRQSLLGEIFSKGEWKKWVKEQKKAAKEKKKTDAESNRLFVVRFDGDMRASQVTPLRECISAIVEIANPKDEVLVVLESPGGFVPNYGLAASQLQRIREHKLNLTVAIDKCAASGGYLMACVANTILAAPFAIIGSIGVVGQLPNFHRLLKKHNIDFELHTAGEYKRTLTIFGENTDKDREKFQEEIEETHTLFKEFIAMHRPSVVLSEVATGEHWHAAVAKKLNLIDGLQTSDDFILDKTKSHDVYELAYEVKPKLSERLFGGMSLAVENTLLKLVNRFSAS